ncbi:hypothetical protein SAMN06298216_4118 [Spirosomataceae bacterium TFI 002]|nr:hypothetical protein SAMN06298216_4118 [Spirosomataceae bacterium TFI 002]
MEKLINYILDIISTDGHFLSITLPAEQLKELDSTSDDLYKLQTLGLITIKKDMYGDYLISADKGGFLNLKNTFKLDLKAYENRDNIGNKTISIGGDVIGSVFNQDSSLDNLDSPIINTSIIAKKQKPTKKDSAQHTKHLFWDKMIYIASIIAAIAALAGAAWGIYKLLP